MSGTVSLPVMDRAPIVAIAAQRITSPAIISLRRSNRSARAPERSISSTWGSDQATPTSANADGWLESS